MYIDYVDLFCPDHLIVSPTLLPHWMISTSVDSQAVVLRCVQSLECYLITINPKTLETCKSYKMPFLRILTYSLISNWSNVAKFCIFSAQYTEQLFSCRIGLNYHQRLIFESSHFRENRIANFRFFHENTQFSVFFKVFRSVALRLIYLSTNQQ